jgi:hypothetical protein
MPVFDFEQLPNPAVGRRSTQVESADAEFASVSQEASVPEPVPASVQDSARHRLTA